MDLSSPSSLEHVYMPEDEGHEDPVATNHASFLGNLGYGSTSYEPGPIHDIRREALSGNQDESGMYLRSMSEFSLDSGSCFDSGKNMEVRPPGSVPFDAPRYQFLHSFSMTSPESPAPLIHPCTDFSSVVDAVMASTTRLATEICDGTIEEENIESISSMNDFFSEERLGVKDTTSESIQKTAVETHLGAEQSGDLSLKTSSVVSNLARDRKVTICNLTDDLPVSHQTEEASSSARPVLVKSPPSVGLHRRFKTIAASSMETQKTNVNKPAVSAVVRSSLSFLLRQASSSDIPGKTPEEIAGIVFGHSRRQGMMRALCAARPAALQTFMQSFVIGISFGVTLAFVARTLYTAFKWVF